MKAPKPKHEPLMIESEQGEALLKRLESRQLTEADHHVLAKVLKSYFWLAHTVKEANISLHRLKVLLFGAGKKTSPVPQAAEKSPPSSAAVSAPTEAHMAPEKTHASMEIAPATPMLDRLAAPGHGRLSADDYPGATTVVCPHGDLVPGDRCPACERGRLYALPPGISLRIDGQAPFPATRYEYERLRCAVCGAIQAAALPVVIPEKYTPQAKAVLTVIHYGLALPFLRLEQFQSLVGVPLPDATQWGLVESVADCGYRVFEHLLWMMAQATLLHQDDTPVRILSLIRENQADPAPARTGMYTTCLVAEVDGQRIILYFSGRAHAGENLTMVLKHRDPAQPPLIKVSDALSANQAKLNAQVAPTIDAFCNAHGLRKFTDIEHFFPAECAVVLRHLRAVYRHEYIVQAQKLNPQQRLAYHQAHSGPEMAALKVWIEHQFETRAIEPHSSLGQACRYLLKHWQALTAFLRIAGVPLDNNIAERALKKMIQLRKSSLFFASEHGAYVGSLLVSLIATCQAGRVNPVDYFVALQMHRSAALRTPEYWLPWNYHEQLTPALAKAA